jgi:DNA mismatch endonuclease (patch repair protein)
MSDIFTKTKRSEVMSRIRSRGNQDTEVALARLLRKHHITGWRRQVQIIGRAVLPRGPNLKAVPQHRPTFRVRPDFVFRQARLALFVDGCFWHGCPKHGTQPKGNRTFWKKKFAANIARDRLVNLTLRKQGWRVLRIWEHDLHRATMRQATMKKVNETPLLRRIQRALNLNF